MNRCNDSSIRKPWWTPLVLGLLGALLVGSVLAQTGLRQFPKQALRGSLVVTGTPQVTLDGNVDRLSPGARIRNTQNMIVMPGSLNGKTLVVNYVREMNGLIHEVWILTEQEALEKRAGKGLSTNVVFESQKPAAAPQPPANPFQSPPRLTSP